MVSNLHDYNDLFVQYLLGSGFVTTLNQTIKVRLY